MDGLLEIEQGPTEARESGIGPDRLQKLPRGLDFRELLVSVERDVVGVWKPIQKVRQLAKTCSIRVELAAQLDLEVSVPIGGDHLVERLRQTVVDSIALIEFVGLQRIGQTDRVTSLDLLPRPKLGQECVRIEG
jgi:hypothetical protein